MDNQQTGRRRPVTTAAAAPAPTPTEPDTMIDAAQDGADAGEAGSSEADATSEELVEARVLVAFGDHAVNTIHIATEAEIDRLWRAGQVDPHPDAVAAVRDGLV